MILISWRDKFYFSRNVLSGSSPFDKLPVEIIQMIFKCVIDVAESNVDTYNMAHISKRFQVLSFSLSSFWEKIIFSPRMERAGKATYKAKRRFPHTRWILVSAPPRFLECKVDISIKDNGKEFFLPEDVAPIFELLRLTRARQPDLWRSLQIDVENDDTLRILSHEFDSPLLEPPSLCFSPLSRRDCIERPLLNLERLEIRCRRVTTLVPFTAAFLQGFTLPHLKVANFEDFNLNWMSFQSKIENGSLEELHLKNIQIGERNRDIFKKMLRLSPNLHSYSLINTMFDIDAVQEWGPHLTQLRHLKVAWSSASDLVATLNSLRSSDPPILEELTLCHLRSFCEETDSDSFPLCRCIRSLINTFRSWTGRGTLKRVNLHLCRRASHRNGSKVLANHLTVLLSLPLFGSVDSILLDNVDLLTCKLLIRRLQMSATFSYSTSCTKNDKGMVLYCVILMIIYDVYRFRFPLCYCSDNCMS